MLYRLIAADENQRYSMSRSVAFQAVPCLGVRDGEAQSLQGVADNVSLVVKNEKHVFVNKN